MAATDPWALAMEEQEAAAESIGGLTVKDKPEENGTSSSTTTTKTTTDSSSAPAKTEGAGETKTPSEEDDRGDKAAQSLNKLIRSNLVNTTNQVEVLQRDPNSPLYSVKSFAELRLKPQLLQGVYGMGFNRPSKIQETALPMMLAEPPRNLITQSQSGTGKTAAFVMAMLSHVDPNNNKYPQCLCVSPTYELALQSGKVLDEADVMISTQNIRIQRILPKNCQMLPFSATFEESVWNFAQRIVPDPNIIKLKREETMDTIKQYYVLCNSKEFQALCTEP